MGKTLILLCLVILSPLNHGHFNVSDSQDEYLNNLKKASDLYLAKKDIPNDILLCIVPNKGSEFAIYYETTGPEHKLYETNFFYDTTELIFEKAIDEKNEMFYLPALRLASFADGEFAEDFIERLEQLIAINKKKFCESVKGKNYLEHNPIKWYYSELQCE